MFDKDQDDDYDDDLMMIFGDVDLLMYGCKYLMIQMVGFSEDII